MSVKILRLHPNLAQAAETQTVKSMFCSRFGLLPNLEQVTRDPKTNFQPMKKPKRS